MSPNSTLSVKPIIRYPRVAQVGKTYLMVIDLEPDEGFEWQHEEEDYPVYCKVDSEIFSSQSIGEPIIGLHRFGGSYGKIKILLTAFDKEREGQINVTFSNKYGIAIRSLSLECQLLKSEPSREKTVIAGHASIFKKLPDKEINLEKTIGQDQVTNLLELLQQCTVNICLSEGKGWGTGFFVVPGLILTCEHVVRRSPGKVQVGWQNRTLDAVVERSIPAPYDLALLRVTLVDDVNPPCVWLDEEVQPGDPLYLFGYPDQDFPNGCPVTFNYEGLSGNDPPLIKFALGQVLPGMSGSPLLNQRTGKVCGMVKFTRDRSIDLGGGAIPSRVILEQFPQLRDQQRQFHQANGRWHDLVTKSENKTDFEPYLQSLTTTYEKWWTHYTLTEATSKAEQPAPKQPPIFDFGLMVQTIEKETPEREVDQTQEKREKIESLPVLEGIRRYADDHVLLVGRPGSGKSTALIRLLLEEATQALQQGKGQVPVLVELRYWERSIEGLIHSFLKRHGLMLDEATLSTLLGQGRFLLLIDGLNELPSEVARTQLSAFRRNHPKVPMIFSTRDLGLEGDLGIERKLEMLPLTEAQMQAFIRAFVPEKAETMMRILSHRLRGFGQTPLLLWMLCEVFQQSPQQQMPTNLAEVFRTFTTAYENSSTRKHEVALLKGDVRPSSDRHLWKQALTTLAAFMMQGETPFDFRVSIHRNESEQALSKIFAEERFSARDVVDDLLKYHLLQCQRINQIEFCHQLLQEYYSAEHLLRLLPKLSDEQLKRDYLNLLKWTEPIALMLALVDDETQALRVVRLALNDVDLKLGARLTYEVKPAFKEQTIDLIRRLKITQSLKDELLAKAQSKATTIESFQADGDSAAFGQTIKVPKQVGNQKDISKLLKSLEDQDSDVRGRAIAALGQLGSEAAIPGLLRALKDSNSDIRGNTVAALGQLGSEAAIPGLLQALEDPNSDVRGKAIAALGQLGSEAAIPGLLRALEDPNSDIRRNAVAALGQLGLEAAIPGLLQSLQDQDFDVRRRAINALGQLGSEAAIPGLLGALEDQDSGVRLSAAEALGKISGPAMLSNLWQVCLKGRIELLPTISAIQNRCKFFNYELAHKQMHADE